MLTMSDPNVMLQGEQGFIDRDRHQHRSNDVMVKKVDDLSTRKTQAWLRVSNIDLTRVKNKLCKTVERGGQGWDMERAKDAELWYRRFLCLHLLFPDATLVPIDDMDEMWHTHILDTKKYHQDCQTTFGHYFHHLPMTGESVQESERMGKHFEKTLNLLNDTFGELPISKNLHGSFCVDNDCTKGCADRCSAT